jgi:hypothetical protein
MLEVRVVDDLRSTIELSFHKESIKVSHFSHIITTIDSKVMLHQLIDMFD